MEAEHVVLNRVRYDDDGRTLGGETRELDVGSEDREACCTRTDARIVVFQSGFGVSFNSSLEDNTLLFLPLLTGSSSSCSSPFPMCARTYVRVCTHTRAHIPQPRFCICIPDARGARTPPKTGGIECLIQDT